MLTCSVETAQLKLELFQFFTCGRRKHANMLCLETGGFFFLNFFVLGSSGLY